MKTISNNMMFLTIITLLSTYITQVNARGAIGGSGGLMGRGGPSNDGSLMSTDAQKFADIGEGTWLIPPLDSSKVISSLGKEHRNVSQYIVNVLGSSPLCVKLQKRSMPVRGAAAAGQSSLGGVSGNSLPPVGITRQQRYRAQVTVGSNFPKPSSLLKPRKLRSIWYMGNPPSTTQASNDSTLLSIGSSSSTSTSRMNPDNVLTKSYEENISSTCADHLVVEIMLPKTKDSGTSGGNPLIIYSVPVGIGTMNPKSRVTQSNGVVMIYPKGRKKNEESSTDNDGGGGGIVVGSTNLHLHSGPGVIDWTWAKGKKVFWKGRSVGQV